MAAPSEVADRYAYKKLNEIGSGASGDVYLCQVKVKKALKEIRVPGGQKRDKRLEQIQREADILKMLRHENVLDFFDFYVNEEGLYCIVTEYCEGGDLSTAIENAKPEGFEYSQTKRWSLQILKAVAYIHSKGIMHRDIKPGNIFMKDNILKLGDFGLARPYEPEEYVHTFQGTPSYMAPEIFKFKRYKDSADIWSVGCVLYEICSLKKVCTRIPPSTPAELGGQFQNTALYSMIMRMLQKGPRTRPSAREAKDKIRTSTILLIGDTGCGKSATGNSILGKKQFKVACSSDSETICCQSDVVKLHGQTIKVIDGPGTGNTQSSEDKAIELLHTEYTIMFYSDSEVVHAFLIVLEYGRRFTGYEVNSIQALRDIFGPTFISKFGILLFTHGDGFEFDQDNNEEEGRQRKSIKQWISEQSGGLADLVSECGNRVVLFDNRTEDPSKQEEQVKALREEVEKLGGVGYTAQQFRDAKPFRKKKHIAINKHTTTQSSYDQLDTILTDMVKSKTQMLNVIQDALSQDKNYANDKKTNTNILKENRF